MSLGTLEPPGTWSSSSATSGWLLDVHAAYTLSTFATRGSSRQLFASYDYEVGRGDDRVADLRALRVGLGMTFK
jgi:hypothetical protein